MRSQSLNYTLPSVDLNVHFVVYWYCPSSHPVTVFTLYAVTRDTKAAFANSTSFEVKLGSTLYMESV